MIKKTLTLLTVAALSIGLSSGAQASVVTKLAVSATGANESANSGAMSGSASGTFILNSAKGTICATVKVKGLAGVVAAHIHKGGKGVDGGVAVPISTAKFNSAGQTCVKVAAAVLSDIEMNPSMYYFNVHTKTYSNGAVRGQLRKSK